jgi:uncharacterized membrane protein YagU involved in acid resistance
MPNSRAKAALFSPSAARLVSSAAFSLARLAIGYCVVISTNPAIKMRMGAYLGACLTLIKQKSLCRNGLHG